MSSHLERNKKLVQTYFYGLGAKDVSDVPWAREATLRTPLNPQGGESALISGRGAILEFFDAVLPNLGKVEVLGLIAEGDWVCARALVYLGSDPSRVLRVADCFRIEANHIVEQENHYDPRPALGG